MKHRRRRDDRRRRRDIDQADAFGPRNRLVQSTSRPISAEE